MDPTLAVAVQSATSRPKRASLDGLSSVSTTTTTPTHDGERPRRRITRACDRCNQLRTKCDGHSPCHRCVESDSVCEYARTVRKRGKAPQKKVVKANGDTASTHQRTRSCSSNTMATTIEPASTNTAAMLYDSHQRQLPPSQVHTGQEVAASTSSFESPPAILHLQQQQQQQQQHYPLWMGAGPEEYHGPGPSSNADDGTASTSHASIDLPDLGLPMNDTMLLSSNDDQAMRYPFYLDMDLQSYDQLALDVAGAELLCGGRSNSQFFQLPPFHHHHQQQQQQPQPQQPGGTNLAEQHLLPLQTNTTSDSQMGSMVGIPQQQQPPQLHTHPQEEMMIIDDYKSQTLRYPALKPLLPHLKSIMDESLASDLLESYFDSLFDASPHPLSPYIFGFVVRRAALLHPTHPRACSPAMLASTLWISARTSTSPRLASDPTRRGTVCQQLLELTISLLIPLMHGVGGINTSSTSSSDPAHTNRGPLGMANTRAPLISSHEDVIVAASYPGSSGSRERGNHTGHADPAQRPVSTVSLDDIVAYMHIATVTSASEDKRASLRWWGAAWTLALELKLGREIHSNKSKMEPLFAPQAAHYEGPVDFYTGYSGNSPRASSQFIREEQKEERRRVWWILYLIDRHLSLCYNKPILLQNRDCDNLYQPMDESDWQNGTFWLYTSPAAQLQDGAQQTPSPSGTKVCRQQGPTVEFSGPSIFGYMLPLMCILGEVIDLRYARSNPILASHLEASGEVAARHRALEAHLARYRHSMDAWAKDAEDHQKQTALAYSTYLTHTMHILAMGRWDPIDLLDDSDGWTATSAFSSAMYHAIRASESVSCILDLDPDLSFMPFLFGIYLLQSGFLLLLVAEKMLFLVDKSGVAVSASNGNIVAPAPSSMNSALLDSNVPLGGAMNATTPAEIEMKVSQAQPAIVSPASQEATQVQKIREVVKACEAVVRAHEVCIVTLSTEYQKNFRNVMRSVLAAHAQHVRRRRFSSRTGSTPLVNASAAGGVVNNNGGAPDASNATSHASDFANPPGNMNVDANRSASVNGANPTTPTMPDCSAGPVIVPDKNNGSSSSGSGSASGTVGNGSSAMVSSNQQHRKRREMLALYRWTPDGGGLAL